jgi:anti-sigma factor RsiW
MSAPEHNRWEEDLAAYALGALEPEESGAIEAHLADCERCRADLRWLEPAVEVIPESVVQVATPPRLKGNLMEVVTREARAEERRRSPARWRSWVLRPATALAAAAVVLAGIVGYSLRGEDEGPVTSQVPVEVAPRMEGAVAVLEREGDSGTLRVANVPPVEGGEVYQLWVRHGNSVEPSSAFRPDAGGAAAANIPAGLEDADSVLVTREPRAGMDEPSSEPIFTADLD